MKIARPVYKESGKVFHPDKCLSLVAAHKAGKIQLEAWARLGYPGSKMPENVLPGLNSVGFWNASVQQDWGLPWHRNEGIEITFLETGSMPFSIADKEHTILHNEITVTRPWQPHKLGNPHIGVGKYYWIILDVGVRQPHQEWVWPPWIMLTRMDLEDLTKILRQNEQPVWKVNQEIRKCFSKIGELIQGEMNFSKESWLVIYINELLMLFLQSFRSGGFKLDKSLTDSTRTIELFITHLDEHYYNVWTLESMAEHCGLGTTRFVHYFKQVTNMTPMHYLNVIRLRAAAKQLLEEPHTQISKICYGHGFSSGQYFSTIFRKQYGCSPADYRLGRTTVKDINKRLSSTG